MVDREADDFLTFQRIRNPLVDHHTNAALRSAEMGIVETHLPRVDMTAMLQHIDKEFLQNNPILEASDLVSPENKHENLVQEQKEKSSINRSNIHHWTSEEIKAARLSESELLSVPQMKNVSFPLLLFCSMIGVLQTIPSLFEDYQKIVQKRN